MMEIVIKIDEELYKTYKGRPPMLGDIGMDMIAQSIANGTPLPEHHGRLIDADVLQTEMEKDVRKAMSFVDLKDFVWLAPTIIEGRESE